MEGRGGLRDGRTRGEEEEGKGEERENGEGREKGEVSGNSALVVGGIDAPGYSTDELCKKVLRYR